MPIDVAAIYQSYHDNADYAEVESPSKCRAFITACTRMLSLTQRAVSGGQHVKKESQYDTATINQQLNYARIWLENTGADIEAASDPGRSNTVDVSFYDFDGRR